MEVSLGSKLPPDALVALKVGSERKQTKIEVGQARKVEMTLPTKCAVTVLKSMGQHEIPVPKGQGEKLKFQATKPDGSKAEIVLQTRPLTKPDGAQAEKASNLVQALLAEVLEKQPAEPYAFMLQQLKASKDGGTALAPADAAVGTFVKDELMSRIQ